ncbi:MAG: hypothetical protein IT323_20965 [Anaerolineae bacterium]|nr:hypothetical protein [Anaerolineae bacterium]
MSDDLAYPEQAARLQQMAEMWLSMAIERRRDADAETDKVWSARQYGIADTYEDAALHIRQVLAEARETPGKTPDWQAVVAEWEGLANQVLGLAAMDDNRITVAYRRSGGEAYQAAIEALRAALEGDSQPRALDDLRHLLDESRD